MDDGIMMARKVLSCARDRGGPSLARLENGLGGRVLVRPAASEAFARQGHKFSGRAPLHEMAPEDRKVVNSGSLPEAAKEAGVAHRLDQRSTGSGASIREAGLIQVEEVRDPVRLCD